MSNFLAWHKKFENCKAVKEDTSKELMPGACHSTRWGKGIEPISTDKVGR